MRRNGIGLCFGLVAGALIAGGGLPVVGADAKDEKTPKRVTKEQIKEMMGKAHKGEKSPLVRVGAELKKDAPDWEQLVKDAKTFAEMGDVLKGNVAYTDPTKYITAAAEFGKAAGDKDAKKAREAFTNLSKSCSACHYGIPK